METIFSINWDNTSKETLSFLNKIVKLSIELSNTLISDQKTLKIKTEKNSSGDYTKLSLEYKYDAVNIKVNITTHYGKITKVYLLNGYTEVFFNRGFAEQYSNRDLNCVTKAYDILKGWESCLGKSYIINLLKLFMNPEFSSIVEIVEDTNEYSHLKFYTKERPNGLSLWWSYIDKTDSFILSNSKVENVDNLRDIINKNKVRVESDRISKPFYWAEGETRYINNFEYIHEMIKDILDTLNDKLINTESNLRKDLKYIEAEFDYTIYELLEQ